MEERSTNHSEGAAEEELEIGAAEASTYVRSKETQRLRALILCPTRELAIQVCSHQNTATHGIDEAPFNAASKSTRLDICVDLLLIDLHIIFRPFLVERR